MVARKASPKRVSRKASPKRTKRRTSPRRKRRVNAPPDVTIARGSVAAMRARAESATRENAERQAVLRGGVRRAPAASPGRRGSTGSSGSRGGPGGREGTAAERRRAYKRLVAMHKDQIMTKHRREINTIKRGPGSQQSKLRSLGRNVVMKYEKDAMKQVGSRVIGGIVMTAKDEEDAIRAATGEVVKDVTSFL